MSDWTIRPDGVPEAPMAEGETLDWSRDWSAVLADEESIDSSVWTVPAGLAAGLSLQSGPFTTQWIESPAAGTYTLQNRITTSQGRTFVRALVIRVKRRR